MDRHPNPHVMLPLSPSLVRGAVVILALALVGLVACAPGDPVAQVQKARADYEVALNGFYVEPPAAPEPEEESAEEGDAEAEPVEGEGEGESAEEAPLPVGPSILNMDLLVSTTGDNTLEGITVELEHVDAAREVKSVRQVWLDTTGVSKGVSATKALKVEIDDFEPEDAFSVEIKVPVPAEEISNYREFDGVGSGS